MAAADVDRNRPFGVFSVLFLGQREAIGIREILEALKDSSSSSEENSPEVTQSPGCEMHEFELELENDEKLKYKVKWQVFLHCETELDRGRDHTGEFYKNKHVILLGFNSSHKESWKDVEKWRAQITDHLDKNCHLAILKNTTDANEPQFEDDVSTYVQERGLPLPYQINSTDSQTIKNLFDVLSRRMIKTEKPNKSSRTLTDIAEDTSKTSSKWSCVLL